MIFIIPTVCVLLILCGRLSKSDPRNWKLSYFVAIPWILLGILTIIGFLVFWPFGVACLIFACVMGRGFISH